MVSVVSTQWSVVILSLVSVVSVVSTQWSVVILSLVHVVSVVSTQYSVVILSLVSDGHCGQSVLSGQWSSCHSR